MTIRERLMELKDEKNAAFNAMLTPGIDPSTMLGVRVPACRKLAQAIYREGSYDSFLKDLPHTLYDENLLHGLLISEFRNYEDCIAALEEFLPYVDNWAVCDVMSPKVFKKHKSELLPQIRLWTRSPHLYTSRFGMEMLMTHFLDEDFQPEYHEIVAEIHSEEYYLNMMIAWYFATALAKQWDATIPYLLENRLDVWPHNKTIQKAVESYRITPEQKAYLKTLKRKV